MNLAYSFFIFLISTSLAFAGSCCSTASGNSSIMLGESKIAFRSIYTNQTVLADMNNNAELIDRINDERESIQTINMSLSYRLSDYWQIGVSLPYISKSRKINQSWESDEGLGDISFNTAYEFYPEYSRHQFITKSFIYSSLTLPTSPSIFTTERTDLLDTRGSGHTIYTVGLIALKNINSHTLSTNLGFSYLQGRKFNDSFLGDNIETKNSINHNLNLNYSFHLTDNMFFNSSFSRRYTQRRTVSVFSRDEDSLLNTISIGFGRDFSDSTVSFNYMDDFIASGSRGTILSRSITMGYIHRVNI